MSSTPTVLTLLGLGIGAFVIASRRSSPRSLRERAIEAQRVSAVASQRARELAEMWSQEEARLDAAVTAGDRGIYGLRSGSRQS